MNALLPRRKRRQPFELQLTAMIDIFSMIVIFLIKGTVFGVSDIEVPAGMNVPRSFSHEIVETAPQMVINKEQVIVRQFDATIPLSDFAAEATVSPALLKLKQDIRAYIAALPKEGKATGTLLNVVADKEVSYHKIFDTVRVFRESGFETLLFIATGPKEP